MVKSPGVQDQQLKELFRSQFGKEAERMQKLPPAGSHREYFRMGIPGETCIGVYSPDPLETRAFLEFTRHFKKAGLNVPSLIAESPGGGIYLLEDLGDQNLKLEVDHARLDGDFPGRVIPYYKKALEHLQQFQTAGHRDLDYSVCVPRKKFDRQSVLWDLNHFKYFFLKLSGIPFDEQALEEDFVRFAGMLEGADTNYFMYRDFQSRNIMLHGGDLYFVDYQGGRQGFPAYDVASLLYESRVNLPGELRTGLLEHYLGLLADADLIREFRKYYYSFVYIRIFQVLGAYGIRGIVEGRALFLQSIPYAIRNLEVLGERALLPEGLPELRACIERICSLDKWKPVPETGELTVRINSFSYGNGIPGDLSGNGGGFVFDCRALPNPGREEKYGSMTGLDREVAEYLETSGEVKEFLAGALSMVEDSVRIYRERGFDNLMVSFGCTGGQHRSVYCAEQLDRELRARTGVKTLLIHRELNESGN